MTVEAMEIVFFHFPSCEPKGLAHSSRLFNILWFKEISPTLVQHVKYQNLATSLRANSKVSARTSSLSFLNL